MRVVYEFPKKGFKRNTIFTILMLMGYFLINIADAYLRSETDLISPEKYCGIVDKYYFDTKKIRGFSTWRVVIKGNAVTKEKKRFLVGSAYILDSKALTEFDIGRNICISYIPNLLSLLEPTIVQISIEKQKKLNPLIVRKHYLSPSLTIDKPILLILLILLTLLILRIERNHSNGN